jgi:uncharacterized protein YdiU (UPF0061 family)
MRWHFDNTYTRLPDRLFARVRPAPVAAPEVVLVNHALGESLGLDFTAMSPDDVAQVFAGQRIPDGADPIAQAYAGHQFGGFTILGDGRAILLGEHRTPSGTLVDVQFKGSGPTPYSRRGDGRAALGPMLREYIISEAMHGLGIPTTRSLAVVATGEPVYRDRVLHGAVLTRVSASHLRVGTFEYCAAHRDVDGLRALVQYALARHDPTLVGAEVPALALLDAVIARQATLIAQWMAVGFVHGVMNTDNMTISGETIDYGPCAFLDVFDPSTVFSSIDVHGRYAYEQQPAIAQWNLARFAEALLPLLHADREQAIAIANERLDQFVVLFQAAWIAAFRAKLGLSTQAHDDVALVDGLLAWMHQHGADFTRTFRALSDGAPIADDAAFAEWRGRWEARVLAEGRTLDDARALMRRVNPVSIARNHAVEAALSAAERGDLQPTVALLAALERPYDDGPQHEGLRDAPAAGAGYRTFCGT